jgi:SAM-dependent methyltransferase
LHCAEAPTCSHTGAFRGVCARESGRILEEGTARSGECADYRCTPFGDASFDVVWALESLCHADDKGAFYREACRVLKEPLPMRVRSQG